MPTEGRLKKIADAVSDRNLARKGLTDDSPVSPNLFASRNDSITIGEFKELLGSGEVLSRGPGPVTEPDPKGSEPEVLSRGPGPEAETDEDATEVPSRGGRWGRRS